MCTQKREKERETLTCIVDEDVQREVARFEGLHEGTDALKRAEVQLHHLHLDPFR
jgi:hypothetical protein